MVVPNFLNLSDEFVSIEVYDFVRLKKTYLSPYLFSSYKQIHKILVVYSKKGYFLF